jgi:hypothetical protein
LRIPFAGMPELKTNEFNSPLLHSRGGRDPGVYLELTTIMNAAHYDRSCAITLTPSIAH